MSKENFHFSIILTIIILAILCPGILVLWAANSLNINYSFLLFLIPIIILAFVLLIGIRLYRTKYLIKQQKIFIQNPLIKILTFIISGLIPFLLDAQLEGIKIDGLELVTIPLIIVVLITLSRLFIKDYLTIRGRFIHSFALGISYLAIYLMLLVLYYCLFGGRNLTSIMDFLSTLVSILPDIVAKIFLILPQIIILIVPSLYISNISSPRADDILDSNIDI